MATPLHLKILIVGAGISGLTLANALVTLMRQTADLTITILESNHELTEEGAGIQLSPNATRALRSLGLQSACEDFIFLPDDTK
jgi:2-polyprenyl-6-methoxyphenol hydroxylase-like FAD-dependent oxidoreductase